MLEIVFDPEKNQKNIRERGLSFELVKELDWANAYEFVDDRFDYGEERIVAIATLTGEVHVVAYSEIDDITIRVISFRKATKQEQALFYGR